MLEVKNLHKQIAKQTILDNVSFKAEIGHVTGFLGPNGAGKTTTMRIITGYMQATSGEVSSLSHSELGYLPENNPLYVEMRVDEYLTFIAELKQTDYDPEQLKALVKKCGIEQYLTTKIENLSKGYNQRVGLVAALIGSPKYLLLDEPTTGLDPNQKQEILDLIKELAKDKVVLFSSHILSEVTKIADTIVIINQGKIVAQGKTEELIKQNHQGSLIQIATNANLTDMKKLFKSVKYVSSINYADSSKGKYRKLNLVTNSDDESTRAKIAKKIISAKYDLVEMNMQREGLEDLFKKLTKT